MKLDLRQAYQQVPLTEESQKYEVIITHHGHFRYNRLPFGVSSAPRVFQCMMDGFLNTIPGVIVYIDDILVTGKTDLDQEHLASFEEVLQQLGEAGLRLQKSMAPTVTNLGHCIDYQGIHPVVENIQAIRDAPEPHSQTGLKSYLGLLSYYSRFFSRPPKHHNNPIVSTAETECTWKWGDEEMKDFLEASKELLLSSQMLVHFNPQ